jgi:hypothetical protein
MNATIKSLIAVAFLLLAAGLLWWQIIGRHRVTQIPFDSPAWQLAEPIENYRTIRSQMIQDLLRQFDFSGWTREQIIELLGPPIPGEPSSLGFSQWDIVYVLGIERGGPYSLDDEALGFEFDGEEQVESFGLSVN